MDSKALVVDDREMRSPKWYDIWNPSGEKKGKILLSFNAFVSSKSSQLVSFEP